MAEIPKITFGMIVLNGEPFIRYCLRSLYPFAHQIIVVEGATPHAAQNATTDGHSVDTTLETIRSFQREEDPDGKVILVTAEEEGHPSGFWPGEKDQMCRAYASRATGEWLWQVDSDEFYHPKDMPVVFEQLRKGYTAASFNTITFWGSPDVVVDGIRLRAGGRQFRRLFRWGKDFSYIRHRPPEVVDGEGCAQYGLRPLTGDRLETRGVYCYHYALLFPSQVLRKCGYYEALTDGKRHDRTWAQENYLQLRHPFHVHNLASHWSWLEPFHGEHPPAVREMMRDIHSGKINEPLRPMEDAVALLATPWYRVERALLKAAGWIACPWLKLWDRRPPVKRWLRRLMGKASPEARA